MEHRNARNGDDLDMASGTFGYRLGDGAPGAVKVEGLSKVRRDLKALGGDLDLVKGEFLETNRRVAEIVIGDSKKFVPVLSGALAASIRQASTKTAAKVRVGSSGGSKRGGGEGAGGLTPYAGPIHFGWPARRIKPQPFIYEAIDPRRNEIAQQYAERLTSIRNKYEL
jgi:hypothetical protein